MQIVVAPHGAALVLSRGAAAAPRGTSSSLATDSGLTYVARTGRGWMARPVPLGAGARAVLLAGDGGDHAAAVYVPPIGEAGGAGQAAPGGGREPPGAPCALALIDLRTGAVEAAYPVCTPRELPTGLALQRATGGHTVYLATWNRAAPPGQSDQGLALAGARVRRLVARTGALLSEAPLNGLPRPPAAGGSLLLAPGFAGAAGSGPGPDHLYLVEALPGSLLATWGEVEYGWQFPLSATWRLRWLVAGSLDPLGEVRLSFAPSGLRVAPDGTRAYAFDALGDSLVEIDLATGQTTVLDRVPGHRPWGLELTPDRLLVASPGGGEISVLHLRRARPLQAFRAGRAPAGVALAPPSAIRLGGAPEGRR
jgi:hypothetical protein